MGYLPGGIATLIINGVESGAMTAQGGRLLHHGRRRRHRPRDTGSGRGARLVGMGMWRRRRPLRLQRAAQPQA